MAVVLQKRDIGVLEAGWETAALNLIRDQTNQIDLILLDAMLDGKPSRAILEEVQRARPRLRVIVTSAHNKETVDAAFAGLRIDRFIRKPYHPAKLVNLIENELTE
jgi:DNA-binding response OmpR family regulator